MENLKPDNCYNSLFLAADSRNKVDWILGINTSHAIHETMGPGNNSLRRVQILVLAVVSRHYCEREDHISSDSWPIYISLQKDGILFKTRQTQDLSDKEPTTMFSQDYKLAHQAQITGVNYSIKGIPLPDLLDPTQLQKEANVRHGYTASRVYDIIQSLYEKRLISHPKTSSRYLIEDAFGFLSPIMARLLSWELSPVVKGTASIDTSSLSRHVVSIKKADVYHTIIITGVHPGNLSEEEMQVYRLVTGRVLEVFMTLYHIEATDIEAVYAAQHFEAEQVRIIEASWHDVFMRSNVLPTSRYSIKELPETKKGDPLSVCGYNVVHKKQLPVNPFANTELVGYTELNGLGTVSSRINIAHTLVNRKYIRCSREHIVSAPKGVFTYETIHGERIVGTPLTADREKQLVGLESGTIIGQGLLDRIRALAEEMTDDTFNTYSTKEE